jgi:hypothetical protein
MGSLNCSCVNQVTEKQNQFCFESEERNNQEEILNNIKEKLNEKYEGEKPFISIEPITEGEFNENLYRFSNIKELFEEYDSQISEQSQKNLPTANLSTSMEPKDKELIELQSPIKLSQKDEQFDLFKGFVNKNYNLSGKGCYITNDYLYYGYFHNSDYNGKGIMINKDGSSLFGDWVNNLCTGKGILKVNNAFEYEGDFVENKKHGYGVEKYPEGSRYEGEFRNNKKNGKGKYIISKGETYEGEFKDDLFDGEGIYKWPSESREYIGQFKNGNMNGKGINKFKDGSIYEGYYKNGLKHGFGKYSWPNGKVFYGNWLNNKLHGNGYYEMDNEKYHITFRFGKIISTRKAIDDSKRVKFKFDNIVNKENLENGEQYICSICNSILKDPSKCESCSKNYCADCLKNGNEYKKCLNCGKNEYEENLDLLHELISKIKVYCDVCQTELDYKSAINHCHT